ncbi:MAG: heavy metal-binding domain-containing protein [Phycisphaerales bacterium]
MQTSIASSLLAAIAAAALWTTPVMAQHEHGKDERGGDHAHGAVAKAKSFGEASRRIADTLAKIGTTLGGGSLAGVSDDANALAELAKQLGALALAADSGIARDKVKDANVAGKELAEAADALHEVADKGDVAASKAQFEKVKAAASRIEAVAPATYFCPMHCEGAKTYDKPGECPVCHMKLKKQTSEQFTVEVKPIGGRIEAGKPVNLLFTLKDPRGMQVKDVEVVHEMPLHLLMVSKDLSWYAHEHPTLQPDGTFTFSWTFPAGGEYTLFNDFTPKDVGMQVVPVTLKVEGTPAPKAALSVDSDKPKTVDGYTVSLDTGGPVKTGGATHMAYTIMRDGKPVTDLAPYLGAMGHLVIIKEDLKEFVHSHPHEGGEHAHDASRKGGPKVDFEAHFKTPGIYKGWAQFQHGGKVITVPFTFGVAAGEPRPHGDAHGQGAPGHSGANGGAHDPGMPAGTEADEARALYLVPGGAYTQADIEANGKVTAGDRYKDQMAKHDTKPKSGDLLCPITMTKANPKFTWIIGGQTYQFCCPPCIDEFVALAKTSPGELKAPSEYVKK